MYAARPVFSKRASLHFRVNLLDLGVDLGLFLACMHCVCWQESDRSFLEVSTSVAPCAAVALLTATPLLSPGATGNPRGWQESG